MSRMEAAVCWADSQWMLLLLAGQTRLFLLFFFCFLFRKHDRERRHFPWKRHRRPARGIINIWLWFDRCGRRRRNIWDYKARRSGYGEPGFRRSGAPPVRAGRFGSPRRLTDHLKRPQLRAARRCLPAWQILPFSSAHGHTLRSVPSARQHTALQKHELAGLHWWTWCLHHFMSMNKIQMCNNPAAEGVIYTRGRVAAASRRVM